MNIQSEVCTRCGDHFELFVPPDGMPGGCLVNGVPYCWDCVEKVAREIERDAGNSRT